MGEVITHKGENKGRYIILIDHINKGSLKK